MFLKDKRRRRLCLLAGIATAGIAAAGALLLPFTGSAIASGSGGLSHSNVNTIIAQAVVSANQTASAERLRSGPGFVPKRATKMVIAVVARDGKLLKVYAQPDAWVGSQDIAIAKARTAAFFSSNENALTSRIIGDLSQPGGPLWGIGDSNQIGITGSPEYRNGIITFPGGVPLYKDGKLAGGVGVSGDAVDQDEAVAFAGAAGFAPGAGVVQLGMTPPVVPSYP